jgi:hypothetical protein
MQLKKLPILAWDKAGILFLVQYRQRLRKIILSDERVHPSRDQALGD